MYGNPADITSSDISESDAGRRAASETLPPVCIPI